MNSNRSQGWHEGPPVVLVNRNQDPDQVVPQVRHDSTIGKQNLEAIMNES